MTGTPRVLPRDTRICPGNTGACGDMLFRTAEELYCIHGNSFGTTEPRTWAPERTGTGPRHDNQRMR